MSFNRQVSGAIYAALGFFERSDYNKEADVVTVLLFCYKFY